MKILYKAGALFSGIGGFCLGFEKYGIKSVWAIENDLTAVSTYKHNLKNSNVIVEDIRKINVSKHNLEPVDILHAGFPCQSFSMAGARKGFNDPRGKLFFEIIRLINEFKDKKPPVIVLENSPYLKNGEGGMWFLELAKQIKRAGYWFRETNCAELDTFQLTDLPQKRNRLFMVAFSIDSFRNGKFEFPHKKRKDKKKDLSKYINFSGFIDDTSYYLEENNKYFKMISKEIKDKKSIYQLRKYLVRVKEPGVCPTLTANMGLGGHNVPFIFDKKGLRKLTENECLKLQGFPEDFNFPEDVPRAKRYVHIGNAVAVPVAELLAQSLIVKLKKELR